jgi:UDP-N-acetylglucosamine 2-epimerase
VILTAHRPANTLPETVPTLVEVIEAIALPVVFPVHPRTRAALERAGLWERAAAAAHLTAPLGYLDFTALLMSAAACLTDSGGVQKEAYLHSVPCVTMRDTSEWVETIAAGWNRLVDLDPAAVAAALASADRPAGHPPLYGDGDAAARIAAVITAGR